MPSSGRSLIEAVGRVSPFTRSYLVDAHPVSFEKNVLVIGFDPEFEDHLGLVDNARNHTLLQTKLAELGHANCQIQIHQGRSAGCVRAEQQDDSRPPPSKRAASRLRRNNYAGQTGSPAARAQGKACVRSVQQRRFQERSADSKGAGDFQGHRLWKSAHEEVDWKFLRFNNIH